MTGTTLAMLLQIGFMINQDVTVCTMPNLERGYHEANAVPREFFNRKLGVVYDLGSIGLTGLACEILPKDCADIFLIGMTLMEINAIHSWHVVGVWNDETPWTLYRITF